MLYLVLSILSSTAIFIIFKYLDQLAVPTLPVIAGNYFFASATGFLLAKEKISVQRILYTDWLQLAIIIGILFIVMFYIVGRSSQRAGIAITTVASKMSVTIPIVFSILYDPTDHFTFLKLAGILTALTSILLIVYRPKDLTVHRRVIFLPVLLFTGMGLVDSLVKYSQYRYIADEQLSYFSAVLFLISFVVGILWLSTQNQLHKLVNLRITVWAFLLGIANFGSIYFLIRTLNLRNGTAGWLDSSVVFAVNNCGIVVLSVLAGLLLFRENLNPLNRIGVILSLFAIVIFSLT